MWSLKPSQHSILALRGNLAATEDLKQQIDVTHKIQGRFLSPGSSWLYLKRFLIFATGWLGCGFCVEATDAPKHPAMHRTASHVPLMLRSRHPHLEGWFSKCRRRGSPRPFPGDSEYGQVLQWFVHHTRTEERGVKGWHLSTHGLHAIHAFFHRRAVLQKQSK